MIINIVYVLHGSIRFALSLVTEIYLLTCRYVDPVFNYRTYDQITFCKIAAVLRYE